MKFIGRHSLTAYSSICGTIDVRCTRYYVNCLHAVVADAAAAAATTATVTQPFFTPYRHNVIKCSLFSLLILVSSAGFKYWTVFCRRRCCRCFKFLIASIWKFHMQIEGSPNVIYVWN